MSARTLEEFYLFHRAGRNPVTGEPNLYKDITDQMVWDAAIKSVEAVERSNNTSSPKLLCDSCNMINCKLRIEFGILAVECNEYME